MTRALLIATRNRGKAREFEQLFDDLGLSIVTLNDVPALPEVEEDGDSFEHNAKKKAREVAAATSMMVLSDDSGLEVDALDGRPGVYSARYAGPEASDEDNNRRLIEELEGVPPAGRTARYRVVLALADPGGPLGSGLHIEDGACEGRIRDVAAGNNGFGYDPYFEPTGHECTMAELSPEQKNRISHRAMAAAKMRAYLVNYLST